MLNKWKLRVGFEFHVQIQTKHKMFSSKYLAAKFQIILAALCTNLQEPNTNVSFVDLGIPGMLPVLNEDCLDKAIRCSLALGGSIPPFIKFDRKHYIYPDLP